MQYPPILTIPRLLYLLQIMKIDELLLLLGHTWPAACSCTKVNSNNQTTKEKDFVKEITTRKSLIETRDVEMFNYIKYAKVDFLSHQ